MTRYLLLALLFFVSSVAHAAGPSLFICSPPSVVSTYVSNCNTGANRTCYAGSSFGGCPGSGNPTYKPVLYYTDNQCSDPYEHAPVNGQCVMPCDEGQTRGPDGVCSTPPPPCPENEERNEQGQCQCIKMHPQTLDCVSSCSSLAGGTFSSTNEASVGNRSQQGCAVVCSLNIGSGPWAVSCTYIGTNAGGSQPSVPLEGSSGQPPDGSTPAPQDPSGEPEPCPPGTVGGFFNGQRMCAPGGGPAPMPPTDPTPTDPTGLGPKVDQLRNSIEATRSAAEQTGSAINRQTVVLGRQLEEIASKIGEGNGGGGNGGGAGDCDPTADNYFECTGLLEEVGDDASSNLLESADAAALSSLDAAAEVVTDGIDGIVGNSPIDEPTGIGSALTSILPSSSSCQPLQFDFPGRPLTLPCDHFEEFKEIFGWFLWLSTAIYIFQLATKPIGD